MIPFALPLALKTLPWRLIGIGAGVIAILLALWGVYSHVWHKGYDKANAEWNERQRAAEAKAQADSWALVGNINEIDATATAAKTETSKIEVKYRDRIIRTAVDVYRDRPDCRPPAELWRANDDYARDLATASGLGVSALSGREGAGQ